VVPLPAGLELVFVAAGYTDGSTDVYQVLVQWDSVPRIGPGSAAVIGSVDGRTAYDGLYQADSTRLLLSLIDSSETVGGLSFRREPRASLSRGDGHRVIEQSNTSVVCDERTILKLFRRVVCGVSPDVELHRALARGANPHVPQLLGTIDTTRDGQPCPLGMVTRYAADAVDGWEMATASMRNLPVDDAGADFAAEADRLGRAVASVHGALAEELGTASRPFPARRMNDRLAATVASVPALAAMAPAIERRYDALADTQVAVQRIHGDLHLGQVLRTPDTWLLIDFEGEPGQPLELRRQPDSTLRDVAGMLRSFSYAANRPPVDHADDRDHAAPGGDWVARSSTAFCEGYAAASGVDPRDEPHLLAAYALDKAVYEAGYEARHRPSWLHIPMDAIASLLA